MVFVFDFIAHCWATFSALHALLSSHIMTNKNDDDDAFYSAQQRKFGDKCINKDYSVKH